jgi:hypothetical protein
MERWKKLTFAVVCLGCALGLVLAASKPGTAEPVLAEKPMERPTDLAGGRDEVALGLADEGCQSEEATAQTQQASPQVTAGTHDLELDGSMSIETPLVTPVGGLGGGGHHTCPNESACSSGCSPSNCTTHNLGWSGCTLPGGGDLICNFTETVHHTTCFCKNGNNLCHPSYSDVYCQ